MSNLYNLLANLIEDTCGEACWNAKQEECKCSCGGENHGIHLQNPKAVVLRTKRKGNHWYQLHYHDTNYILMERASKSKEKWKEVIASKVDEPYLLWIRKDVNERNYVACKAKFNCRTCINGEDTYNQEII
jgi:hypothetical protein